jgi:hypothetical protein
MLNISWTASTDDYGISQYHICKFLHNSISNYQFNTKYWNSYINVTGLSPSTSYYFRIFARDIDGNFSAPGQSATNYCCCTSRTSYTNRIVCKHFSDTEISTGMQQAAKGMSCIVLLGLMEFMML